VPVLVGTFGVGTRQTIDLARRLTHQGGDAIVLTAPFYFSQTQAEIAAYISAVAHSQNVPTIVYNIPQMAKTIIEPETIAQLARVPEIVAVKDSWGDMTRFQRTLAIKKTRAAFGVYQGAEGVAALSIARGADGAVLGLANVAPKLCVDLYAAAHTADWERAWTLQEQLMVLWKIHTHGQWLPGLKMAVNQLGICSATVAAPFDPLDENAMAAIRRDLQAAGILPR
jgi:4-hydroxy-tetrahydrodipicolinate synthase